MEDKLVPLVSEVERLVTAPYVPSLQDLYGIVQDVSLPIICSWAACKPCQVAGLGDVLVDGLSYSNIALDLIRIFAPVSAFRDVLLEQYPAILDQLLQKAVENEDAKCLSTCTALLSSPLPADFMPPARLAGLVTKLVHKMADSPSTESIRPLYKLITGLRASPRILYDIPHETMSTFQGELLRTLRNMDDHMGNLLCLATFASIASSQKLDLDYEHGPQPPTWLQNARHFFGPKRGLKTLDLVVLRVILACSASCNNLSPHEAAESVRLAIDVCDTVEPEQKQVWISGNSSKIGKLYEKVTREGINNEVQLMGVVFLVTLLPTNFLSSNIIWLSLQRLLSKDSRLVLETMPLEFISRLVAANAVASGRHAIHDSLNHSISALKSSPSAGDGAMSNIQVAAAILSGLQRLELHPSGSTVREVTLALGKDSMSELIERFPRQSRQSECNQSITCHVALSKAENKLLVDLFELYSCACIQSANGDNTRHIEASIIPKFAFQVKKTVCEKKCSFAVTKPFGLRDTFSYLNIHDVSPSPTRDWKAAISETLMSNARASHDGLMKKVEEVCRDLEHRCYNTEAPLRVIEEERDRSSVEGEQLRQQNTEMASQLQQAFNTIDGIQRNMSNLEDHADVATARVEELSANLDAAQKEMEEQRHSFEESIQSEREKSRTKELDFLATLTEKEDQLEELQTESNERRAENKELRQTLDSISREQATTLENVASLRREVSRLEGLLESSQQLMVQKDEEISRLMAEKQHMGEETENLQKKLENETSESNRLRITLRDTEEHFSKETDTFQKHHEMQLSQANAESAKQKAENKVVQESMLAAAAELQRKDKRIQHLERKIQSLRDERAAKAREFSVAQEHIGRLMTVMGFKPEAAESSSKNQRSRSTIGPSQAALMQQTTHSAEDETQTQTDNFLGESFGPNTPNPNGRSPKRPRGNSMSSPVYRPRDDDLTPRVLPTRSRTSTITRRERRPLADADQNSQATSQRSLAPSQRPNTDAESRFGTDANRNKLQEIDLDMDVEFTKDFLFTSTSLSENGQASP